MSSYAYNEERMLEGITAWRAEKGCVSEVVKVIRPLSPKTAILAKRICGHVAAEFGVSVDDLTGPGQRRNLSLPRQVATFVMREQGLSLNSIGKALNRDRVTVRYGAYRIEWLMATDRALDERVTRLMGRMTV